MAAFNRITILGRLGADPELRAAKSGEAICNLRIAVNDVRQDEYGQRQEHSEWFGVVVFGKTGETCARYLEKGRQVLVEGRLQSREYEANDGSGKRRVYEVIANQVVFLDGGKPPAGGGGGSSPPAAPRVDDRPRVPASGAQGPSNTAAGSFADDPIPF